ncbi:MAG: carbohydrate kinase [Snowella sp.]|nr:carbohydrate kinase [Snowella sp.]
MTNQSVIIFGEVLFDCFPDGNVILGGAPFNVAWHLQAFGLSPLFISRIGNDSYGVTIRKAMENWGMDLRGLQLDLEHPTGTVQVNLINDEPHYEIVENSAYDFIECSSLPSLPKDSIFYHGTLALRSQACVETLQKIKANISPSVFLDVNLRTPWWNLKTVELLLKEISWLKLNEEELSLIVPQESNTESRIQYLLSSFSLNNITLTQGKAGAISFQPNGDRQQIIPSQTTQIVDTVGAGDAFSSVLILGIVKGWDTPKTLVRAQEFASVIVGIRGATIQDKSFYKYFLEKWN